MDAFANTTPTSNSIKIGVLAVATASQNALSRKINVEPIKKFRIVSTIWSQVRPAASSKSREPGSPMALYATENGVALTRVPVVGARVGVFDGVPVGLGNNFADFDRRK